MPFIKLVQFYCSLIFCTDVLRIDTVKFYAFILGLVELLTIRFLTTKKISFIIVHHQDDALIFDQVPPGNGN